MTKRSYSYPRNYNDYTINERKCAFVLFVLVLIIAILWFAFPRSSRTESPSLFQKFSIKTNNVFEEISGMYLPAANAMIEHSIAFRKVANMIQRSPAFELHGCRISVELRKTGEKLAITSESLKEMYIKGSGLYTEVESMMLRLDSKGHYKHSDAIYFKERLNKLITKIIDVRQSVEQGHSSILNVEEIRRNNEKNIEDGLRKAEIFIKKVDGYSKYFVDITKAKKELGIIDDILDLLRNINNSLDRMVKILKDYEVSLLDVHNEFDRISKDENGTFEVTKEDLKELKFALDNLKDSHYLFIRKSL